MANDPFLDDSSRVVTLEAFDFVFRNELKRAVRAQNFLTLLQLETTPLAKHERAGVIRQLARLVGGDLRETDLVAEGENGRVWVLLLDTDLRNSMIRARRIPPPRHRRQGVGRGPRADKGRPGTAFGG